MEQQLFLHGAATYPKFLLCPEERTGIDTNEIDDFSEKKNLCLQKKKKTYLSNNVHILFCLSTGTKNRTKTPENSLVSIWG